MNPGVCRLRLKRKLVFPSVPCNELLGRSRAGLSTQASTSQSHQNARFLIMGPPGAGKGTQTKRIANDFDISPISSGDLLRKSIHEETPLGLQAQDIIERGGLVPDDLVVELILTELQSHHVKNWMLDGFPRTLAQAKNLDDHLLETSQPLNMVINLDVPEEVILGRIIDRWIHPASGRTYNMSYNPPKNAGVDDVTGEPLVKRADDNVETFQNRLHQYYEQTQPLLEYYDKQGILCRFAGRTSDEIYPQIRVALERTLLK
ncbi:adenylate kinase-domain-containing protein [Gaertneriomyces semiglobifer]|nr:adenylate kinase-domain-containing protein [Gaertneriomyces semiglobifer]